MDLLRLLLPIVSIAAIVTLLARLPLRSFLIGSAVFVGVLITFAVVSPMYAIHDLGPKLATGFVSWVFPAAALALFLCLAAWRRFQRPGLLAFFFCLPISGIVHYMGAWST